MEITLSKRLLTIFWIVVALGVGVAIGRWWETGGTQDLVEYVTPEAQQVIEQAGTEFFQWVSPEKLTANLYTDEYLAWYQRVYDFGGYPAMSPAWVGNARVLYHDSSNGGLNTLIFARTERGLEIWLVQIIQDKSGNWKISQSFTRQFWVKASQE